MRVFTGSLHRDLKPSHLHPVQSHVIRSSSPALDARAHLQSPTMDTAHDEMHEPPRHHRRALVCYDHAHLEKCCLIYSPVVWTVGASCIQQAQELVMLLSSAALLISNSVRLLLAGRQAASSQIVALFCTKSLVCSSTTALCSR